MVSGLDSRERLSYSEFKDYINDIFDRCDLLDTENRSKYKKEKNNLISLIQEIERKNS